MQNELNEKSKHINILITEKSAAEKLISELTNKTTSIENELARITEENNKRIEEIAHHVEHNNQLKNELIRLQNELALETQLNMQHTQTINELRDTLLLFEEVYEKKNIFQLLYNKAAGKKVIKKQ